MMQDSTLLKPFQISNASIPPPSWQPPPFSGKWRYAKNISTLPQASEFHYHCLQNLHASSYIMKFLLKNCYFCCQVNCKLCFHLIYLQFVKGTRHVQKQKFDVVGKQNSSPVEGTLLHAFNAELKMRDSCQPQVSKEKNDLAGFSKTSMLWTETYMFMQIFIVCP